MAYVRELKSELRANCGSEEYALAKTKKVGELSTNELISILQTMKFPIEDRNDRVFMENQLRAALDGSDKIATLDVVKICSMNREDLEVAVTILRSTQRTISDVQQEFANNCGFGDNIIWDLCSEFDAHTMKDKISQLIPDQEKGQKAIQKTREDIFKSVWAQRKYTNKQSLTSIFYVMVTKNTYHPKGSTMFSCHPVFRCRKCKNGRETNCCMVYIDESGRVYQTWQSFVDDNQYPAGTMVAPRRGVYNFDKNGDVILDVYCTPRGKPGAQAMQAAQTGSAFLGVGAACVPIAAALSAPIAAPVVAGAAMVGLGVGAFSAITSALNLTDRKKHEQSISVTDSQARGSYLGIAGGVLGMAAAGATRFMTSAAAAGKATAGIEMLVNGINISSIVLSGTGMANGVLDLIFKYNEDEKISALDVLQLSASLVLFTHSVYNFQLASQIASEARTNSIKSYRETLSNRQRKMFDKMSKETIRIKGATSGKIDIIRNINKIPNRQYLNDLFKINKQLNENRVRPAFGSDASGVVLNNKMPVDAASLRQSVQHNQGPNLLGQFTEPIPSTYNSGETHSIQTPKEVRLLFSTGVGNDYRQVTNFQDAFNESNPQSVGYMKQMLSSLYVTLPNGAVVYLREFGNSFLNSIGDGQKFQDVILSMAENLSEKTFIFLLQLAQKFIDAKLDAILKILQIYIPTESVLYRMIKEVLKNYSYNLSYDYISSKSSVISENLRTYFLSLNPNVNNLAAELTRCLECGGTYSVCNL